MTYLFIIPTQCVCRREKKRVCTWTGICAFAIGAGLVSFCLQAPPPVAGASSLVVSNVKGDWGVPVTPNMGPSPVSALQPPLCSKDMGTSLICRNYRPRAGWYAGTHETEEERHLLALSPWMSMISKTGLMPHTLWMLNIWNTHWWSWTYKSHSTKPNVIREILQGWRIWHQHPKQTFILSHLLNFTLLYLWFCSCCSLTFRMFDLILTTNTQHQRRK